MKIKKSKSILFAAIIVFGFLVSALPNNALADDGEYVSGCCQFFMDEKPGCLYPSSPDPCANNMNGKFLEGEKCDIDTGYCSGYTAGESTSSE